MDTMVDKENTLSPRSYILIISILVLGISIAFGIYMHFEVHKERDRLTSIEKIERERNEKEIRVAEERTAQLKQQSEMKAREQELERERISKETEIRLAAERTAQQKQENEMKAREQELERERISKETEIRLAAERTAQQKHENEMKAREQGLERERISKEKEVRLAEERTRQDQINADKEMKIERDRHESQENIERERNEKEIRLAEEQTAQQMARSQEKIMNKAMDRTVETEQVEFNDGYFSDTTKTHRTYKSHLEKHGSEAFQLEYSPNPDGKRLPHNRQRRVYDDDL